MLDIGQENDFALNGRDLIECFEQSRAQVSALEVASGRVVLVRGNGVVQRHETPATDGAQSVQRSSVDDRKQPGRESGGLAAGGELFVGVHEGLLRDVLGVGGVAEDGEGAREGGAAVSTHQVRERVLFSRQRAVNQLFVAQLDRHVGNRTPAGDET